MLYTQKDLILVYKSVNIFRISICEYFVTNLLGWKKSNGKLLKRIETSFAKVA